ncbi:MAG: phosphatidylserine/phosphatidylglycerophosphate/cardiolipinsynthase-like protein [Frankiales bacterium]|nr:phosphatidylserine/phosphatidylglycerophosphate/cardiolipinsynthase-like protein [Frankiales bacterium]
MERSDWLLTPAERDNPATTLDRRHGPDGPAWTEGNDVRALVHGSTYFARLHDVVARLVKGDLLCFTDWRGDPDERLTGEPGSEVGQVFSAAAERGVVVKGLLWRSHLDGLAYSSDENRHLGTDVNEAGGEVLLDQRVRPFGSHHQKLVVVRGDGVDVAFAGGIDLCHSRRDDRDHRGDPQGLRMSEEYGDTPPWHDVQLEVRGPAVGDLEAVFRERWDDPAPLDNRVRMAVERRLVRGVDTDASALPLQTPDPAPAGTCTVQVLRTYPARRTPYPFAPRGERSVAAAYRKALRRARRLVYLEDQYLWSAEVAELFAEALTREPDLHLVGVVPRFPDQGGRVGRPPNLVGRQDALDVVVQAGGDRVRVFDLENCVGTPVYVHAKVCLIDDVWSSVGSDNLNMRSWTHDSELSCAVLDDALDPREPRDPAGLGDGARRFARDLRLELWREHLDTDDDAGLVDTVAGLARLSASAEALDAWHDGGRQGPRPPGRLRTHHFDRLPPFTRTWARPLYHLVVDPDGRPRDGVRRTWQ